MSYHYEVVEENKGKMDSICGHCRGQRESNFQVDTISILIVATIVDIDIEIDIDIINRRC